MTRHIRERIALRVPDPATADGIVARIRWAVANVPRTGSVAVYVYRDATPHGPCTGDVYGRTESNGANAVVIIRDGTPVTLMWRRDDQPRTPAALRVDAVRTLRP